MSWCDKVLKNSAKYWERYGLDKIPWGGNTAVLQGGGYSDYSNIISYITLSTLADAASLGETSAPKRSLGSSGSDSVNGFTIAGDGMTEKTQKFTFSQKTDVAYFADMYLARYAHATASNGSQCVTAGTQSYTKEIEVFICSSSSKGVTFGNLLTGRTYPGACGNSTHGLFANGTYDGTNQTSSIERITHSTKSNGTSFGNLTMATKGTCGCCDKIYGYFKMGGSTTVEYVTVSTLSTSQNFCNLPRSTQFTTEANSIARAVNAGGDSNCSLDTFIFSTKASGTLFGTVPMNSTNSNGRGIYMASGD